MISQKEFELSLLDPIAYWAGRSADEVASLLGCEASRMVGFDQRNPHHRYDLFTHTLHTVEGVGKGASALLRTAAFFHDIGKPDMARVKVDKLVFYGHPQRSAEISKPLLHALGYLPGEAEEILFYIVRHDDFISWELPEEAHGPYSVENIPR